MPVATNFVVSQVSSGGGNGPLTPVAGTRTTPPFALNHPRFLVSNILQGYDTVTATSSTPSSTPLNALKPNTFEKWRFSTSDSTLNVDFGETAKQFDMLCIGGHNLGNATANVQVWYKPSVGAAFLQFAQAEQLSFGQNKPLCFYSQTILSAVEIELRITGCNGVPEMSYVSAGVALQMQRPIFNGHTPITDGDVTSYYHNKTESGNIIGQSIRSQGYKTEYSWQNIDDTWYRTYFAPFKQAIKTQPFFIAWNLLEYPLDVGFGRVAQDISTSMQNGTVTKRGGLSFELLGF